jgi:hypothetical protein
VPLGADVPEPLALSSPLPWPAVPDTDGAEGVLPPDEVFADPDPDPVPVPEPLG